MGVREKLTEILKRNATCIELGIEGCDTCPHKDVEDCYTAALVDHLITHGVTVQELDGCDYCKEDKDGYRKMIGAFSITNPFYGNVWNIETCHCKPRQIYFCPMCGRRLPQPPKGG